MSMMLCAYRTESPVLDSGKHAVLLFSVTIIHIFFVLQYNFKNFNYTQQFHFKQAQSECVLPYSLGLDNNVLVHAAIKSNIAMLLKFCLINIVKTKYGIWACAASIWINIYNIKQPHSAKWTKANKGQTFFFLTYLNRI